MSSGLVTAAYIVAAILFIFSLAGLSKQETAKQGCYSGVAGMAVALFVTVFSENTNGLGWIIIAMLIGAAIGIYKAKKVEMTEMPELIALLHSFVGLAAVLVGFNSYIEPGNVSHDMHTIHLVEVYLGIFIGAVTFTGSLVAFGKLNGKISSAPLQLPAKHKLNLAALVLSFILMLVFISVDGSGFILILMTLIAPRIRLALGRLHRRCGYARGRVHAELLLRLGCRSGRLHALQRPAHRNRRAGRLQRRDSVLHHV